MLENGILYFRIVFRIGAEYYNGNTTTVTIKTILYYTLSSHVIIRALDSY